jgi:hypothetical protein
MGICLVQVRGGNRLLDSVPLLNCALTLPAMFHGVSSHFHQLYLILTMGLDQWYMSEDPSARPASIVDRVEARWKGSIMYSQETKKRLFGSEKVSTERTRVGVIVRVLSFWVGLSAHSTRRLFRTCRLPGIASHGR